MTVINLGLGPSEELRKILLRQERLLKEISAPTAALADALAFRDRVGDLGDYARRIGRALDFVDLRPFEQSGLDELKRIGERLQDVATALKPMDAEIPTTGLLGLPVDFARLAENERLSRVFADAGYQGLFADIAYRFQKRSDSQPDRPLGLSEVLEVTAAELSHVPEAAARSFDPISLLSSESTRTFASRQKGHWKSTNSTTTAAAFAGPILAPVSTTACHSSVGTFTICSLSCPPRPDRYATATATAAAAMMSVAPAST